MKILQVHNRYQSSRPSGENRVVDLEAAHLTRRGHDVERFERSSDEIASWPALSRALVASRVVWSQESYRAMSRTIREVRPDVVHLHNVFPLLSPSVLYACSERHVPIVTTLHNYRLVCPPGTLFRDGAPCHACVGRLPSPAVGHGCYRGSKLATLPFVVAAGVHERSWRTLISAYVCLSAAQRRILAPFRLPEKRVFVKHNLVPALDGPEIPARARDSVVFIGRLDEAKGVSLLMEAWDRYTSASTVRELRLVIAGTGPLSGAVSNWARAHAGVEVVGFLDPEGCRNVLAAARAAVIPSQWEEPFGLVVVEAMAAGVPVVAPAHGSFPELVLDGAEATLFEPGSVAGLAHAIQDVEQFPDRYRQYGRSAREGYRSRFDPDANVDQLLAIYEFAIGDPARRSG